MVDICHRVGIAASPATVYETLSTTEGLARWWTSTLEGDSVPGGALSFFFGRPEPGAVMEVTGLEDGRRVTWFCQAGPDEWVGTTLTFDLDTVDAQTVVKFSHAGWREPVDFFYHCSTKWAYFLLSLKEGLEGGQLTPFPDDMAISSWG